MRFIPLVVMPAQVSEKALWFACGENQILLRCGTSSGLDQLPTQRELGAALADAQVLGTLDDQHCLTVNWSEREVPAGFEWVGLRALWSRFDEVLFAIVGRANQLAHFSQTHRFCGRCGSATERDAKERALRCPKCSLVNYPRISPCIITLVRRGDEALLASSARFPVAFFSTLAGFCEVGESLEQTLKREVFEEVGLQVTNIRYAGSQAWPFPHSLMVAFMCDYESGEIVVDGEEIREAKFFRADQLPPVPPKISIARALIDTWVDEVKPRNL